MGLVTQAEQIACFLRRRFLHDYAAVLHRLFQFFLVVGQQSMNLAVRFVANSMDLRPSFCRDADGFLSSSAWILSWCSSSSAGPASAVRSQLQIFVSEQVSGRSTAAYAEAELLTR